MLVACSGAGPLISLPWAMNPWCAQLLAKSSKVAEIRSQSLPKWLPKSLQKPYKFDQQMKPKINTKNLRFWLPKWSQNGAKKSKSQMVVAPFLPSKKLLRFLIVFWPVLSPSGLPLASLLAPFGSFWLPFWLPLDPFGLPFRAFCHPLAAFRLP